MYSFSYFSDYLALKIKKNIKNVYCGKKKIYIYEHKIYHFNQF